MPLSTKLKSGDRVEIITNPNRTPSHDWLKLVKTSSARSRIRKWLKQAGFDQSVQLGKEMVERKLRELRVKLPPDDKLIEFAQMLDRKTVEDLFNSVGNGSVSANKLVEMIAPQEEEVQPSFVGKVIERIRGSKGIKVQGMGNMMFRFAGCCQPVPGEEITGFITRGRGVTIHRADCPSAVSLQQDHPERRIEVSWDTSRGQSFVVQLDIMVEDRKNMLRDVTQAIADSDTNVRAAEMRSEDATGVGKFVIEVGSLSHLNRVMDKVRKVKGVISVKRAVGLTDLPDN